MQVGSLFNVGAYQVSRTGVNPELIRRMADSAGNIKIEGNPSSEDWDALASRVEQNDCVSPQDLKQIQDLGRACFKYHRSLHTELRASRYQNEDVKAELQDVHVFRAGSDKIRESLALSQSQTAVEALAGASFGPTGLVVAYAAYSDLQKSALEPLVDQIQGLRDGSSASLFQGNQTESFHGDQIWKQMNDMLDGAIADGKAGHPQEIDAQYYELTSPDIVGKLAQAAEAGNKVRINVDPGRIVAFQGDHVVIDEVPDKLRALLQLAQAKGDVGISAYPISKQLGNANNLMHRKGLRIGDKFLLSGMNANMGSGENIDAGYVIEGPAAKKLVQNFARDVSNSAGATNSEVYGEKPLADFMGGDINMGSRGLISLFDCVAGPAPAGSVLPKASSYSELEAAAKSLGQKVSDYTDCSPAKIDSLLSQGQKIPLSQGGKEQFLAVMNRTLEIARSPENLSRLQDISVPEGNPAGTTAVALADVPTEREALMLTALQEAKEFIYIPAFVMTKTVAAMIVAKRDEMREQGKELDIRVIADSGVYPDGGTPNETGVAFLEDAGIEVRWALLPRSGDHDRKIHAKEILTDQGEFYGSTNFSKKGLRQNWEHSGYTKFSDDDPQADTHREAAKAQFLSLWDNETFSLNTRQEAEQRKASRKGDKDYDVQVEEARSSVVRDIIGRIANFERASAKFVSTQVGQDINTAARIQELEAQGYDEGSATLNAVREKMGDEAFYAALAQLPERQALDKL